MPRALNTEICLWQSDLFYSVGLHRNHVLLLATANTGEIGRGFGRNASEWTGRVGRSEEGHTLCSHNATDGGVGGSSFNVNFF